MLITRRTLLGQLSLFLGSLLLQGRGKPRKVRLEATLTPARAGVLCEFTLGKQTASATTNSQGVAVVTLNKRTETQAMVSIPSLGLSSTAIIPC